MRRSSSPMTRRRVFQLSPLCATTLKKETPKAVDPGFPLSTGLERRWQFLGDESELARCPRSGRKFCVVRVWENSQPPCRGRTPGIPGREVRCPKPFHGCNQRLPRWANLSNFEVAYALRWE